MAEVGMRLADSALSHVSGHAPVGMLAFCPFDWMTAKADQSLTVFKGAGLNCRLHTRTPHLPAKTKGQATCTSTVPPASCPGVPLLLS
jgi:hypothetical protein